MLKTKEIIEVDYIFHKLINGLPEWFKILLILRNYFAKFLGLKTGKIDKTNKFSKKLNLKQGQSLGDFLILLKEKHHFITELKDRHLDFRFSIMISKKEGGTIILFSTIVKLNNFFGRIYFLMIKPFHRLIVPKILKRLSKEI